MARIKLFVNMLFWFTTEKVYLKTEREISDAKELAKKVARDEEYKETVRINVDYDVKETKEPLTGKRHTVYNWHKTTRRKVTIKEEMVKIAKLIDKLPWLNAYHELIKDVKTLAPTDIAILIIPEYIYVDKEVYSTRTEGISAFYKMIYQILDNVNNVIVWKDEDNYIMTHNKKILIKTTNGTPGFKMETTALRSIYSKLTQKNVHKIEDADKLLVDKRFLKNPYYGRLVELSRRTKNVFLMKLIHTYINRLEHKDVEQEFAKNIDRYEITFECLDITMDPCLKTNVDKFIYKVYYLAYIKIVGYDYNDVQTYIEKVRDEQRAQTIIAAVKSVLGTELKLPEVYDTSLRIEDRDYVKTEVGSVQLLDNNDPHKVYLNEEEEGASASSDSPTFSVDYEVQFEDLHNTLEGEL